MSNEGTDRFIKLEAKVIAGLASAEEIRKFQDTLALARGERGGIVALLRESIDQDREMIKSFPVLINDPEHIARGTATISEFDEDAYAIRRQGMISLLHSLETILIGELS